MPPGPASAFPSRRLAYGRRLAIASVALLCAGHASGLNAAEPVVPPGKDGLRPQSALTRVSNNAARLKCRGREMSDGVEVNMDGQVIENLSIRTNGAHGIDIKGASNVVIRNVTIRHRGGAGIRIANAANVTIQNVDIINLGAPKAGADKDNRNVNIECTGSPRLTITHARLSDGVSNMHLQRCPNARLRFVEGHNTRGVGYANGGSFILINDSSGTVLEDFSSENDPAVAETCDTVNVYNSTNVTIRRGLVDGNNSPTARNGGAVVVDTNSSNVVIEDVDVVRSSIICFSGWGKDGSNRNLTFNRIGCRDNLKRRTDGQAIAFNVGFAIHPKVKGSAIRRARYWGLPEGHAIPDGKHLLAAEFTEVDFKPRAPQRVRYCQ